MTPHNTPKPPENHVKSNRGNIMSIANDNFELNQVDIRISEIHALHDYLCGVFDELVTSYCKTADIVTGTLVTQLPLFISIVSEALNMLHRGKYETRTMG